MTFAGAKFLVFVVAVLVGILVDVVLFMLSYNLFFANDTKAGVTIGVLVFTTLVGIVAAIFAHKLAKNWAVSIIAAWAGIAIGITLIKVFGVENTMVSLVTAILFAVLGFYLGKKLNKFVKTAGTAIIGSFLLVRGVGSYLGGYPGMSFGEDVQGGNVEWTPAILGYVGGTIVLAIVGSIVQNRLFKDLDTDSNDYMENDKEAGKCGCFCNSVKLIN
jgi:hypothetical protein